MSININLLAWRDARRQRRTRRFGGLLVLALVLGAGVALGVSMIYQQKLDEQQLRNDYIAGHIQRLEQEIEDVEGYQADAVQLGAQLELFTSLQSERIDTVALFNALSSSLTDGVVYQQLVREGARVRLTATANDERQVSEQLRRIARVPYFAVPILSEVTRTPDQQGRRFSFEVVQTLHRASAEVTPEEAAQ